MNFTFESQGGISYMIYEAGEDITLDSVTLGMLTNNKINGLAPTLYTQIDTEKIIKYNVSTKVPASDIFSTSIDKNRLCSIFIGILDAVISVEEYMIDLRTVLFDLNYIYVDVSTSETYLICVPLSNGAVEDINLMKFFKEIMFGLQFNELENCDYVGEILKYINSNKEMNPTEFKGRLEAIKNEVNTSSAPVKEQQEEKETPQVKSNTQVTAAQVTKPKAMQPSISQPRVEPETVSQPENVVAQSPINKQCNPSTVTQVNAQEQANTQGEDKISFMKLMTHYSQENKEKYKAQKAQGKSKKKKKEKTTNNSYDFVVPGAPVSENIVVEPQQQPVPVENTPQNQSTPVVYANPEVASQGVQAQSGRKLNFGETTVLNQVDVGATTVLSQSMNPINAPYLYREKTAEKIQIISDILRIGKEKSFVDYYIGDNKAISRNHANIIKRNDEYYVIDKNSTNHTYLNGEQIISNQEIAIESGDIIKLGDEIFEFRIGN